jgi:uncharacterized protein (TIGR04255 family)
MTELPAPFSGPPPAEVPLPRAPLVRVIGQISFHPILALREAATVAPFQERIRAEYPVLRPETVQRIEVAPSSAAKIEQETIWRFSDADQNWRVSLTPNFLALETPRYTSRTDFLRRLNVIITALQETVDPRLTLRIGLRYISRVEGDALSKLTRLIQPGFLGALDTAFGHAARHLLTESLLTTDEGMLTARWGKLPPHATVDPHAIEPIATASWIHDLDLFTEKPHTFNSTELMEVLEGFAKRLYAVFRSMVTDDYLTYYGGKV